MGNHHVKKPRNPYRPVYIFLIVLAHITAAIWLVGAIRHG